LKEAEDIKSNLRYKKPSTGQEMAKFLNQKLKILFKKMEINFAYLGGSWVNNEQNWWSDIDIFISVPSFLQLTSREQLKFLTQLHIIATDLTKFEDIEFSILEAIPLHVQFNVIANGILLYEKNPEISILFIEKLLPFYYDHMIWYNKLLNQSEYI